jgi:predicted TIM-barrel fold metal-dependent hydrolase
MATLNPPARYLIIISVVLVILYALYSVFFSKAVINFEEYEPKSTLVVKGHEIKKAKFPFIDVHSHIWDMDKADLKEIVSQMDSMNMKVLVNLSGQSGDFLYQCISNVKSSYPERFIVFANIDFKEFGKSGWIEKTLNQLEKDVKVGARGLKIYESLGFNVRDETGRRVSVDDPRLDPIWSKCGELKIPVLIHTAAPRSFWEPLSNNNERLLELTKYPDRKRNDNYPAPWQKLINEQHKMFRKHQNTIFIAAHLDWHGGNLEMLGKFLDSIPNMYTEFGAVIAEIGRQPKSAKSFFEKYQDRILFGKDSWVPEEYKTYFRVLETEDEYFPYHKKYHAFWRMYGLGLSDEILKKIYFKNALKIIPSIDKELFPDM